MKMACACVRVCVDQTIPAFITLCLYLTHSVFRSFFPFPASIDLCVFWPAAVCVCFRLPQLKLHLYLYRSSKTRVAQ